MKDKLKGLTKVIMFKYFFTHKSYLPSDISGKLFSPLHIIFAVVIATCVILLAIFLRKINVKKIKILFICIWVVTLVLEVAKILWETFSGPDGFYVGGYLPLYPCSIFMYVMPFIIWCKKESFCYKSASGYLCTIGFIGALVNFIYPQNVLSNYPCYTFAGLHTLIYHALMLFVVLLLLLSKQYDYKKITDGFLALIPLFITAIPATIVNYLCNASYLFLRGGIFPFSAIHAAMPEALYVVLMIVGYFLASFIFYLPYWIAKRIKKSKSKSLPQDF